MAEESREIVERFGELWSALGDHRDPSLGGVFGLYEREGASLEEIADAEQVPLSRVTALIYQARFFLEQDFAAMRRDLGLPPLPPAVRSAEPALARPVRLREDPNAPPLLLWGLRMFDHLLALTDEDRAARSTDTREVELEGDEPQHLLEAGAPATSPERLALLAHAPSREVRALVAAHPKAPLPALLELVRQFPVEVAHHPTLIDAVRATPALIGQLSTLALPTVFCLPELPALWWELGEVHLALEVREAVVMSPHCPPATLGRLAIDEHPGVRTLVAGHDRTPPAELARLANDRNDDVRERVARHPHLPPEAIGRLAGDRSAKVAAAALRHPGCPAAVLREAARSENEDHRVSAAGNPSCPVEGLDRLAADPALRVRLAVARHPACPLAWLARWATAEEPALRARVAAHPACPEAQLRQQASDTDASVVAGVAAHARCPLDLLEELAGSEHVEVRSAVASNPSASPALLERLSHDTHGRVVSRVAIKRRCPAEVLERLAEDAREEVRESVAANEATPTRMLERLARDPNRRVRAAVSFNEQAPAEVRTLAGLRERDMAFLRLTALHEARRAE